MAHSSPPKDRSIDSHYFEFVWENGRALDPDVVIDVGDIEKMGAHKFVLISNSAYFSSCLAKQLDVRELHLPNNFTFTFEIWKEIMKYMYTGILNLNNENISEIKEASTMLGMAKAVSQCDEWTREHLLRKKSEDFRKRRNRIGSVSLDLLDRMTGRKSSVPECQDRGDIPSTIRDDTGCSLNADLLKKFIRALWQQGRKLIYDIKVTVGNVQFTAHKLVLSCHSRYFAETFSRFPTLLTLTVPKEYRINALTFSSLLKYMYTEILDITLANIHSLHRASIMLQMPHLTDVIQKEYHVPRAPTQDSGMIDVKTLRSSRPPVPYQMSTSSSIPNLSSTVAFSNNIFPYNIKPSGCGVLPSFPDLTLDEIINILSNNYLIAPNEFSIFRAALAWLMYQPAKSLEQCIIPVMKCVRFQYMTKGELGKVVSLTLPWFRRIPGYREQILKGNWDVASKNNGMELLNVSGERYCLQYK